MYRGDRLLRGSKGSRDGPRRFTNATSSEKVKDKIYRGLFTFLLQDAAPQLRSSTSAIVQW